MTRPRAAAYDPSVAKKRKRSKKRARRPPVPPLVRPEQPPPAAASEQDYGYVYRDLRRIALLAGTLFAGLVALRLLIP